MWCGKCGFAFRCQADYDEHRAWCDALTVEDLKATPRPQPPTMKPAARVISLSIAYGAIIGFIIGAVLL